MSRKPHKPITRVQLEPITLIEEKSGEYFLTEKNTRETYFVPRKLARILLVLSAEPEVKDAKQLLLEIYPKWRSLDDDFRIAIEEAKDLGLVVSINNGRHLRTQGEIRPRPSKKRQQFASIFFSPIVFGINIFVVALASALLALKPEIFPTSFEFWWSDFVSLNLLTLFILEVLLTIGHEAFHYLAAMSRGVRARFGLSTRLTFVVAETSYDDIFSVVEGRRYRIYWAGMVFDLVTLAVAFIVLGGAAYDWWQLSPFVVGILGQLIILQMFGLVWQFLVFMQTDVYYFMVDWLDHEDLYEDTLEYWRKFLVRVKKKGLQNLYFFPISLKARERRQLKLFGSTLVAGTIVVLIYFIFYALPITWEGLRISYDLLVDSYHAGLALRMWDALFALVLQSLTVGILLFFVMRWGWRKIRGMRMFGGEEVVEVRSKK